MCLELLKKKKSGLFTTLYLPLRRSSKYWVNKNWTQLKSFNYFIIIITSLISRDLPVQLFFFFLVLTSFTGLVLLYRRSKPLNSDCKASLRVTRISFYLVQMKAAKMEHKVKVTYCTATKEFEFSCDFHCWVETQYHSSGRQNYRVKVEVCLQRETKNPK